MRFADAYILARTKRKTRRIRMALVIVVSSLLFALLFGLAFLTQGLINAGSQVGDVGFNSRHLTSVMPMTFGPEYNFEKQYDRVGKQMDAELKARGVEVSESLKNSPAYQDEFQKRLSKETVASQVAANKNGEQQLRSMGNPTGIYHFSPLVLSQAALYQPDPDVDPLVKQLQQATDEPSKLAFNPFGGSLEFFSVEKDMIRTQVAPGQTLGWKAGQPYPIVVAYSYLEQISGRTLANLPPAERNAGYRTLIEKYTGEELNYCYRNLTAQEQLQTVLGYNKTVEKDDFASTKPIKVPVCANLDQTQLKSLGLISDADPTGQEPLFPLAKTPGPVAKRIKFRIVGFVPSAQQFGSADIITQVLTSIGSLPTGPNPGVIPLEVVNADPILKEVAAQDTGYNQPTLFVDFATRDDQKAFVAQGCSGMDCSEEGAMMLAPFGNIKASLEGVFKAVSKVLFVAAIVIMIIAGLMIMFTISKVIADSVKEIAVFRSLGARRRDIAQIYYTYGMMLAGNSLAVAVIVAALGAYLLTTLYDDKIAQGLVMATGAFNADIHVVLLGVNPIWTLGIIGALVLAASLGIAVPVLASARRKLITILREE